MNALNQEECKRNLAAAILRSTGTLQLRATGSSMLPTLWPGECLTIQSYNFEQAEPGDLVLYGRDGRFFIHRILRKCHLGEDKYLIARGDCRAVEDPTVHERDLLGKVTAIHRQGSRITPARRLSPVRLLTAWLLCHWNLLLRGTLRMHGNRSFEWSIDRARV
jgi:hypothetical protein